MLRVSEQNQEKIAKESEARLKNTTVSKSCHRVHLNLVTLFDVMSSWFCYIFINVCCIDVNGFVLVENASSTE